MKIPAFCTLAIVLGASPSDAFLNLINKVNPSINKFADAQENALLKIHLDIGNVNVDSDSQVRGNRLGIDGLLLELHGNQPANYPHPKLPGADGPSPQLSTGSKSLSVLREGRYVDLTGSHHAKLDRGAWEMIWRNNAPAGALICGFDVPQDIKRNDASLPAGRVYVTFPVWTTDSLKDLRERKSNSEERAVEALDRQKDELRKMQETNNLIMKALHFRNACKANEDLEYSGFRTYSAMPLDRDMISMNGGLHLCSLGTVWTKKEGFFGGEHVLLGSASAASTRREDLLEKKVVSERELKSVAFDGLRP